MMEILEKLLGSAARVKIMRLFLFNPERTFDAEQVKDRSKVSPSQARSEIGMMQKIGLIKKRSFYKDVIRGKGSRRKEYRVKATGWTLNEEFEYLEPLQHLLIYISPLRSADLIKRLSRVGKLKLVITAGIFIQNWDSRVDLLVVGDDIRRGALDNLIKILESEVGREIRYATFETKDFQYRLGVYDKLVRDILDFPHEMLLNRIGLTEK